ncbi:hypothetical protein [Undibacterium luofuense]|uniref:Bacteriocin n=1 Tax=Undibacterium luofuense TaxID=2828733 RepID=A0A941DMW1_9BURK|nr:hypothetical protein [Undibacterium luofuense]MBR7782924.1 hypothetical protein [Undibacterium luofuense]
MQELKIDELEQIHGGDGVMTVSGVLVGIAAGALVIGTGGGILVGAVLGGAIWGGGSAILEYRGKSGTPGQP